MKKAVQIKRQWSTGSDGKAEKEEKTFYENGLSIDVRGNLAVRQLPLYSKALLACNQCRVTSRAIIAEGWTKAMTRLALFRRGMKFVNGKLHPQRLKSS